MSSAKIKKAVSPQWLLFSIAFLVLIAATAQGILRYPELPDRFAIHWNGAGSANGFADKSIASAFSSVFVGLGILLLFVIISVVIASLSQRQAPQATPSIAATQTFLGVTSIGLTLVFWLVGMQIWSGSGSTTSFILILLLVVITLLIAGIFGSRRFRAVRLANPELAAPGTELDSRADERYWIGGLIYNNPADAAIWVPKRSGLGLTINWARPGGKAISLGLLAIPVISIALALWLTASH